MSEDVGLKSYLEAFTAASNRARSALILIIVASVLVFSAVWNWSDLGWMNARLRIVRIGLEGCNHHWSADYGGSLPAEQSRFYERARRYLELRYVDPNDCDTIKAMVADLSKARLEQNLLLHVPFFGIVIDVNDLGLIGGVTFWILLFWLRSSLRREMSNLQLVFLASSQDQTKLVYDLTTMREVLYFPPIRGQTTRNYERHLTILFYWVPAILQAATITAAAVMCRYLWIINPVVVVIDFVGSSIALIRIVWLTVGCVGSSSELTRFWLSKARDLEIMPKS